MNRNPENFIFENDHSLRTRLAIFSSIIAATLLWVMFSNAFITGFLQNFLRLDNPGPNLLLRHIFIFGMPDFLFCLACLHILARYKLFKKISFKVTKDAFIHGLIAGMALAGFAVAQWLLYGLKFQFVVNYWSITGNLFSNFYEEIIFRAFMIPLFNYLFRNIQPAVFFSSLIFALVHARYPLFLQLTVFVGGFCFAISYVRTKTVFAPWLGHQLADTIADAILKL
ncbi:MAG TPA: CPBP family intramembrane metalloprotease [Candidatus Wallbacteria bacterium]|nr:CPBP family intramembrane metalloprotease [Candidatus Wallbacteria bacterium]